MIKYSISLVNVKLTNLAMMGTDYIMLCKYKCRFINNYKITIFLKIKSFD
jgi:hypothetical protein